MNNTDNEYSKIASYCKDIYAKKLKDYGPAWRILRHESLTDQIYIKVKRIRSLQINKNSKVNEGQESEFIGIVNYSIIALIQLEKGFCDKPDIDEKKSIELYDKYFKETKELMLKKNYDYGEAWRYMRISSLTDLILQKVLRVKQIEDNKGKTLISEGIDANYQDMINYSIFSLILMNLKK